MQRATTAPKQPVADRLSENQTAPSAKFTAFVSGRLHVAFIRSQLQQNEIPTIGTALSGGVISPETAIAYLNEAGLLGFVTGASYEQ